MNVIVSKTLKDEFRNFIVISSLKKLIEIDAVDIVIIHSYEDTDFDAGVFISSLREKGVSNFLYITSNPSAMMRMTISGAGGIYIEDEFYFDDEEELNTLLDDIKNTNTVDEVMSVAVPALDVVNNFIDAFVRREKRISSPIYLAQVKEAITVLENTTQQQQLQIESMGSSALDVFKRASEIIKGLDNNKKLIEQKLNQLENHANTVVSNRQEFNSSVIYFNPYVYLGNANVLLFREYTYCKFVTSFVLAYAHYLRYTKNKQVKVIFVTQKGFTVTKKYEHFSNITQESLKVESLYDEEIIYTNTPKKEVLKKLLEKKVDVVLVVDRLYGKDDIVTGRVKKVNIGGSEKDITRFHLEPEDTIFTVIPQPKQLFCIPVIKNFPKEEDSRLAIYYQTFLEKYETLNKILGIN